LHLAYGLRKLSGYPSDMNNRCIEIGTVNNGNVFNGFFDDMLLLLESLISWVVLPESLRIRRVLFPEQLSTQDVNDTVCRVELVGILEKVLIDLALEPKLQLFKVIARNLLF
jgi:hypothetical protein